MIGLSLNLGLSRNDIIRSSGLDLDFVKGRYALNSPYSSAFPPGWSFSRTGAGTALDSSGNVIQFPSRTNLLVNSVLAGGGTTPTGWALGFGTGASTPVPSAVANTAYTMAGTAQRAFLIQTVTLAANSVYTFSVDIEAISGTPNAVAYASNLPAGATSTDISNPMVGRRTFTITTAATAGTAEIRVGLGVSTNQTGSVTFSNPQLETGSVATAHIPTTTAPVTVSPPRITDRGLLVEEARTNLFEQSNAFDNVYWSKSNVTVTTGLLAPDGTLTAQRLAATASASTTVVRAVTVAATAATFSVFVKRGSGGTDANTFILRNATTATILRAGTLNYDTGVFTYTTGADGVSVQTLADGWYRLSMTATSGITSGNSIQGYVCFGGNSETAGENALAWCAQLEAGSFATSPIITTGAAATRGVDIAVVSGLINLPAPFTLYTEFERVSSLPGFLSVIAQRDDGTATNRILNRLTSLGLANAVVVTASSVAADLQTAGAVGAGVTYKIAARYADNDARMASGGVLSPLDSLVTIAAPLATLRIGSENVGGGNPANSYIRRIRILPYAATDAQLQALTT